MLIRPLQVNSPFPVYHQCFVVAMVFAIVLLCVHICLLCFCYCCFCITPTRKNGIVPIVVSTK